MTMLSLDKLTERLEKCVREEDTYDSLRSFVYSRYEGEEEIVVDDTADELLSVLAPYIETETAFPDSDRHVRLRRLSKVLEHRPRFPVADAAVFALCFDELMELEKKRQAGKISQNVFETQIERLSPADFNVRLLCDWVNNHSEESQPRVEKML